VEDLKLIQSDIEYASKKSDILFWKSRIAEILELNNLKQSLDNIKPGFNSTYPVFVLDDFVIKFFCYRKNWQHVFKKECAVHQILAKNLEIFAPKIVGKGEMGKAANTWAYTISTRVAGDSWLNTKLTRAQQINIFFELGKQLKMVHSLPIDNNVIKRFDSFEHLDVISAAQNSSLPNQLIHQVNDFLGSMPPFDKVLVNSDIVLMHVFISHGHLSGIIDWGDAAITDRHYELGKLCLEFPGDKELLKNLLEAADWPVTETFAHQALGMALYRQAVGLTQHRTFDTFHKLPNTIEHLDRVETLDELSKILFQVE